MRNAYVGNDDFRGYLAAIASGPGGMDANAQRALDIGVGNDGGYNSNSIESFYDTPVGPTRAPERDAQVNWTNNEYGNWLKRNDGGGVLDTVGGGGAVDPNALTDDERAYLDNSENTLRGYLGDLDTGLNQGRNTLNDSYNRELSNANSDRGRTVRDFEVKDADLQRGRDNDIAGVNSNARTLSNSVRRILGMASGSGSSAYQIAAPDAVARKASGERTNVMENFGQNFRNLDTAKKDSESDFNRYLQDLELQKNQRSMELEGGIESQRGSLNQQLAEVAGKRVQGGGYAAIQAAQAPFLQAAQTSRTAGQALFDKFRTPVNSVKGLEVKTPNLRDYIVDRAAINANKSAGQSTYSPYQLPQNKDEEELRVR